jgi:Ca-activated chloride channel family protein
MAMPCSCVAQETATFRADSNLVRVEVSATDRDGKPVAYLHAQDFVLLDKGNARPVQYIWREIGMPLTVGLIADVSGSQSRFIAEHRRSFSQFLEKVLRPQDRAFLVSVAGQAMLVSDFTNSADSLQSAVDSLGSRAGTPLGEPCPWPSAAARGSIVRAGGRGRFPMPGRRPFGCGGTALWNGIFAAARLKMRGIAGRKALIVLSDGMDTGSTHSLTDAIEAAQGTDTIVYSIFYGFASSSWIPMPFSGPVRKGVADLKRLSAETGGNYYKGPADGPAAIFAEIEEELRNLYVLGFTIPQAEQDGVFHKLEVKSKLRGVTLRARSGYTAADAAKSNE